MSGISASPHTLSTCQRNMKTINCSSSSSSLVSSLSLQPNRRYCSDVKLKSTGLRRGCAKLSVQCSSSSSSGGPGSGENDTKGILDAFFLGKALAEAINERIESTVGELLSAVGRLQAEQQKQVQDFQEEVLERAKIAKEKAARETLGSIPKSTTVTTLSVTDVAAPVISTSPVSNATSPDISASSSSSDPNETMNGDPANKDPLLGMLNDD